MDHENRPEVKRLQDEFKELTGEKWINSQGEPDIEYVQFLENKIFFIQSDTGIDPELPVK